MDVNTQTVGSVDADTNSAGEATGESPWSFLWFVVKLVVAVLLFRILVFSPFSIPSESMLPRLMNGDYLLAAKWPYGYSNYSLPFDAGLPEGRIFAGAPDRGDIVIFKHPIDKTDYIKRVVGLPGDTVSVIGGQVVINGDFVAKEEIDRFEVPVSQNTFCAWGAEEIVRADGTQACQYRRFRETLPSGRTYEVLDWGLTQGDNIRPVIVPEGHMFVMGDNRDNSRDSRFEATSGDAVGIVSQDLLVGRASFIIWSTDGSAEWIKPWTWFSSARWSRIGRTI